LRSANRVAATGVEALGGKSFSGHLPLVMIAIGLSVAMAGAWVIQRTTGLSGWIDTTWSLAVGAGSIAAAIFADGSISRRSIALLLVAVWSLRLASHIGARTRGAKEDPRYAKFIEEWGGSAPWRLFVFLQVQAVAAFVLVLAVFMAAANGEDLVRTLDFIAIAVGFIVLGGEAASVLSGYDMRGLAPPIRDIRNSSAD